jgi:hypothetical protein
VIHELLLLQRTDSVKWERLLELRTLIGETTIVPAIEKNNNLPIIDKIEPLLKQWDDHNVFGGPTLVSQIRKLLVTAKTPATSTTTTTEESSTTTPKSPAAAASASKPAEPLEATTKEQEKETLEAADEKAKESTATNSQDKPKSEVLLPLSHSRRSSLGSLTGEIDYDFESKVRKREAGMGLIDVGVNCFRFFGRTAEHHSLTLTLSSIILSECSPRQGRIPRVLGSLQGHCHFANCSRFAQRYRRAIEFLFGESPTRHSRGLRGKPQGG